MDEKEEFGVASMVVDNVCYLSSDDLTKLLRMRAKALTDFQDEHIERHESGEELPPEEIYNALVAGEIAEALSDLANDIAFDVMRHMTVRETEE